MKRGLKRPLAGLCFVALTGWAAFGMVESSWKPGLNAAEEESEGTSDAVASKAREDAPSTIAEARGRARLLHETLHGVLQVVHRDFFREDEKLPIPSKSLEDVFAELARTQNVQLRWLAVDTEPMSVDHKPTSDFDQEAVKALRSGKTEFESVTEDSYRHVGTIRLSAECLGCHLPSRSSNKDRAAGLVITLPLKKPAP